MEKIIKGNERINSSSGRPRARARTRVRQEHIYFCLEHKSFQSPLKCWSSTGEAGQWVLFLDLVCVTASHEPVPPAELQRRRVSERMSVNE